VRLSPIPRWGTHSGVWIPWLDLGEEKREEKWQLMGSRDRVKIARARKPVRAAEDDGMF